jgi:mono/diheme cytochrome c family protein
MIKVRTSIGAALGVGFLISAACSSDDHPSNDADASTGATTSAGGSNSGGSTNGGSGNATTTGGSNSAGGSGNGGSNNAGGSGNGGGANGGSDAGGPDASDGGTTDGGDGGVSPLVARGAYLVNAVALCGGCHTDRTKPTAVLAGNATFRAGLPAPNLTSDATGLGSWSDAQIKAAFMTGMDDDGKALSPVMPYQLFHNLTDADADAIVAYLRSLPHVQNDVGEKTIGGDADVAADPFPLTDFPDSTLAATDPDHDAAEAGRYLLSSAAQCARCHSPAVNGAADLGVTKTFIGGAPNPTGTPANQYAPNITPDATGISAWTPAQIVTLLKTGVDNGGKKICGPMSVGPTGGYGKLTDLDATNIGVYLTTLPPIKNAAADPKNEPTCP